MTKNKTSYKEKWQPLCIQCGEIMISPLDGKPIDVETYGRLNGICNSCLCNMHDKNRGEIENGKK